MIDLRECTQRRLNYARHEEPLAVQRRGPGHGGELTRSGDLTTVALYTAGPHVLLRQLIMSDAPTAWKILHVADTGPNADQAIGASGDNGAAITALERLPRHVDISRNLYVAMARLIGDSQRLYRAAAVCIDGLTGEEFEFFLLLQRHRPELDVLVYSRAGNDRGIRAALERGAALWSEAGWQRVISRAGNSPATRPVALHDADRPAAKHAHEPSMAKAPEFPHAMDRPSVERSVSLPAQQIPPPQAKPPSAPAWRSTPLETPAEPAVPNALNSSGSADDEGTEPSEYAAVEPAADSNGHDVLRESARGPARVPWLRYADAPTRRKPSSEAATPPADDRPPPSRSNETRQPAEVQGRTTDEARPDPFAPLLTEEELRALMSDDYSDVGVEERESLLGNELAERADEPT